MKSNRTILLNILVFICVINKVLAVGNVNSSDVRPPGDKDQYAEPLRTETKQARTRRGSHKLRIQIEYTNDFNRMPSNSIVKEKVINRARRVIENALSPKSSLSEPISLSRDCIEHSYYPETYQGQPRKVCSYGCDATTCSNIEIPMKFLKSCLKKDNRMNTVDERNGGYQNEVADIALVVTSANSGCNEGTLAWASTCRREASYDRPILGMVNICPGYWNNHVQEIESTYYTVLHEIIHALGFSGDNFVFFRKSNGEPYKQRDRNGRPKDFEPSSSVVKRIQRTRQSASAVYANIRSSLVTPRLLEEARSHFNCSTLDGIDLEDYGGSGSAGGHFEKRTYGHEVMTSTSSGEDSVFSRLTLALLEDTGFYTVDYSTAEPFKYGKNLGCTFVLGSCFEYIESQNRNHKNIAPFCNRVSKTEPNNRLFCSVDRSHYLHCQTAHFKQLPAQYSVFKSADGYSRTEALNIAGTTANVDYCPMGRTAEYNANSKSGKCSLTSNRKSTKYDGFGESWGTSSSCFETKNAKVTGYGSAYPLEYGAACYERTCNRRRKQITIHLSDGQSFECKTQGQTIPVKYSPGGGYRPWNFEIVCPLYEESCGN